MSVCYLISFIDAVAGQAEPRTLPVNASVGGPVLLKTFRLGMTNPAAFLFA